MQVLCINKTHILSVLVFVLCCAIAACEPTTATNSPNAEFNELVSERHLSMREQALFRVGNIVSAQRLYSQEHEDAQWRELLLAQHNSITAENDMKMTSMFLGPSSVNFERANAIVAFALEHDLRIHGHALLWHESVPGWLHHPSVTDSAFAAHIKWYIDTTVSNFARFRDHLGRPVVRSWDVVNEYLDGSAVRNSVFVQRMGPSFIDSAFAWARTANEDVLLFYNDYNLAGEPLKRDMLLHTLERFRSHNIPIDGIGLQMHVFQDWPRNDIPVALRELSATGLQLHISELDVRNYSVTSQTSSGVENSPSQASMYHHIAYSYTHIVPISQQFGITFWGLRDTDSWLFRHGKSYPCLFTHDYRAKSAFFGVLSALRR